MVKAVLWVAALHIQSEGFAEAVGAALVCMTGNAVLICSDEDSVVVVSILIDQLLPCEVRHLAPFNATALDEVRIDPAHITICRRKCKRFGRLLHTLTGRGIRRSLLSA